MQARNGINPSCDCSQHVPTLTPLNTARISHGLRGTCNLTLCLSHSKIERIILSLARASWKPVPVTAASCSQDCLLQGAGSKAWRSLGRHVAAECQTAGSGWLLGCTCEMRMPTSGTDTCRWSNKPRVAVLTLLLMWVCIIFLTDILQAAVRPRVHPLSSPLGCPSM